jgi:hypothetical protein
MISLDAVISRYLDYNPNGPAYTVSVISGDACGLAPL